MENNQTKLTAEVYGSIVDGLVKDIVRLKKQQGETINRISVTKEALIAYKNQLKQAKKNIRVTKTRLRTEKNNLRRINDTLNTRNHSITELSYAISDEQERTIDLSEYSLEQTKRR